MPVIVLAGEEEFELTRRVAELKSTLLVPPWHTINFIKFNNPDFSTLAETAATLVMGQGKRIVLVEDCQFLQKKEPKLLVRVMSAMNMDLKMNLPLCCLLCQKTLI